MMLGFQGQSLAPTKSFVIFVPFTLSTATSPGENMRKLVPPHGSWEIPAGKCHPEWTTFIQWMLQFRPRHALLMLLPFFAGQNPMLQLPSFLMLGRQSLSLGRGRCRNIANRSCLRNRPKIIQAPQFWCVNLKSIYLELLWRIPSWYYIMHII